MVGYMQGSKRARNTPSIANKTSVFGIMGGLTPRTGTSNVSVYRHQQIKGSRGLPQLYGKSIDYQKNYLKTNKLLSVNPLGSGGVGKKTSMFHQSCNCSQNIPMSLNFSQHHDGPATNTAIEGELIPVIGATEGATEGATATTTTLPPTITVNSNTSWSLYYSPFSYSVSGSYQSNLQYDSLNSSIDYRSIVSGVMNFRTGNDSSSLYSIYISNPYGYDVDIVTIGAGAGGGGGYNAGTTNYAGGAGGGGNIQITTFPKMKSGTYYIQVGKGGGGGGISSNGYDGTDTIFYDTDQSTKLVTASGGLKGTSQYAKGGAGGSTGMLSSTINTGGDGGTSGHNTGHNAAQMTQPLLFNVDHIGVMTIFMGGGGGGGGYAYAQDQPSGSKGYGARVDNYNDTTEYNSHESADYWCGGDGGGYDADTGYNGNPGAYSKNQNSLSESSTDYYMMTSGLASSTETIDGPYPQTITWNQSYNSTYIGYGLFAGAGGGGGLFTEEDYESNHPHDGGDGADGMCSIIFNPPSVSSNTFVTSMSNWNPYIYPNSDYGAPPTGNNTLQISATGGYNVDYSYLTTNQETMNDSNFPNTLYPVNSVSGILLFQSSGTVTINQPSTNPISYTIIAVSAGGDGAAGNVYGYDSGQYSGGGGGGGATTQYTSSSSGTYTITFDSGAVSVTDSTTSTNTSTIINLTAGKGSPGGTGGAGGTGGNVGDGGDGGDGRGAAGDGSNGESGTNALNSTFTLNPSSTTSTIYTIKTGGGGGGGAYSQYGMYTDYLGGGGGSYVGGIGGNGGDEPKATTAGTDGIGITPLTPHTYAGGGGGGGGGTMWSQQADSGGKGSPGFVMVVWNSTL